MAYTTVSTADSYKRIYPVGNMYRPHVETNYNGDALSNNSGSSEKNIFLLGSATDGDPNAVYEVGSLSQAKGVFGSGDLVDAMELIWNPTNSQVNRGGTVYALRVDSATPAKLDKGRLQFSSHVFGDSANHIMLTLDKDVVSGARRLRVVYDAKNYDKTYTNIGNVFSLAYTGEKAFAKVDITSGSDSGEATKIEVSLGDTESAMDVVATYDLTQSNYSKLYQVLNSMSSLPGFNVTPDSTATSIDTALLDVQTITLPSQKEVISKATADGADVTVNTTKIKYAYVTSLAGSLVNKIRNDAYLAVTVDMSKNFPDDFYSLPLSGATSGNVPVSWSDKFEAVNGHNVYYIVPLTEQENIHAELKEFLVEEHAFGKDYRGFVGGGFGESDSDAIARRVALNSDRIALVANSGYYNTLSDLTKRVPAYVMAAYVAGVASSLSIGGSVTNKYLDLVSLDQEWAGDVLDTLDANGVIAIEHIVNRDSTGGYRIVEDVTTSNATNEPTKANIYLGELTDFLFTDLRIELDKQYIGSEISLVTADTIKASVVSFLTKEKADGLIIDFSESNILVTLDGQNAYIIFSCQPARSLRNIIVNGVYENYSTTTSNEEA